MIFYFILFFKNDNIIIRYKKIANWYYFDQYPIEIKIPYYYLFK
jgi:hypothetical protein